jgi:hypothetical protein
VEGLNVLLDIFVVHIGPSFLGQGLSADFGSARDEGAERLAAMTCVTRLIDLTYTRKVRCGFTRPMEPTFLSPQAKAQVEKTIGYIEESVVCLEPQVGKKTKLPTTY